MAKIKSFDVKEDIITANVEISTEEYEILSNKTDKLVIFPADVGALNQPLTTGKLGNSNRIMVPKKFLETQEITKINKKVPAGIFKKDDDVYLLIKIKDSKSGPPTLKWETKLVRKNN